MAEQPVAHGPASRVLIGRERELAELRRALADALAGRGGLFLLVGEPGIGKTRLADELARDASERGAQVLWGRCWEGGGAPAYWPWIQIVRALLRDRSPESVVTELGTSDTAQIAHLVPELRENGISLTTSPAATEFHDQEDARFPFYDAMAHLLAQQATRRPLVVVLDDLHAADSATLLLLQFIARELRTAPILLLGTYRAVEIDLQPEHAAILNRVAREGHRIALTGLAAAEVARFMENVCGSAPSPSVLATVHATTDGNPFFLDEVVRQLLSVGGGALPSDAQTVAVRIPHGIRDAVHERLRPLSVACRRVLTRAAVIGREFDLACLEAVADMKATDVLDGLGEATALMVVVPLAGAVPRYSFSHALIRETLYDDCPPSERLRLHQRIGEALERLYDGERDTHTSELAHHFLHAAPVGDIDKAVRYARRAGDHATAQFAYEEAVAQYVQALQAAALRRPADLAEELAILLALGETQARGWHMANAPATFERAAELAKRLNACEPFARAVLGLGGVGLGLPRGGVVNQHLLHRLEDALAGLPPGDSGLRVRLLARMSVELYFSAAVAQRRALSKEAVEIAGRLGDPGTLAYAVTARHFALWDSPDVGERLATANQGIEFAQRAGDRDLAAHAHTWKLLDLIEMGAGAAWERELDVCIGLAQTLRQPRGLITVAMLRGMRALWTGAFDDLDAIAQEIIAIGERIQDPAALGTVTLQRSIMLRVRGQYDVLEPIARAGVQQFPGLPIARAMLAVVYADLGREAEARVEFEQLVANDFRDLQQVNALDPLLPWLTEVCVFLGDARRAATLEGCLQRYATRVIPFGPRVCFGPATYSLGLLAGRFGRADDAVRYLHDAIERCEQMGGRPAVANAQYALAGVLLDRGGSRDLDQAEALALRALATARSLDMQRLVENIVRLQAAIATARATPHDEPTRARAVGGAPHSTAAPPASSVHDAGAAPETGTRRLRGGGQVVQFPSRRSSRADGAASPPVKPTASPTRGAATRRIFRRDGEYWTVGDATTVFRFKDTKGFGYIAQLLQHPGRAFHVSELAGDAEAVGQQSAAASPTVLRERVDDLRDQLQEALRFNDPERAGRLREELDRVTQDFIASGGRGKADVERMRLNVTRAIKAALKRMTRSNASLGRDLSTTIKTGTFCSYVPDPRVPLDWHLSPHT